MDLDKFIAAERPGWLRLDEMLARRAEDPWAEMTLEEARELERLYLRASADLARLSTLAAEPDVQRYLERLVARGYAEVHGGEVRRERFQVWRWLRVTLPQAWRRQRKAFGLALALMLVGAAFGGAAVAFDPEAKPVIMPFSHLLGDPSERVAEEEAQSRSPSGHHSTFAGQLMTHNTQVTLTALALGLTWGVGTLVLMFYNGVILGAVVVDYVLAGETTFLLGWLLPHGSIELPAILVGGQAGFVLAGALLGRGQRQRLADRLRAVAGDVVTLAVGAALMLVWAGIVESFISQYHEPVLPYWLKITMGLLELTALIAYLGWSGRGAERALPKGGRR
ncbi:stage II sporulation protein M [Actomonas aquatica]|uniref:Stage II sporulation protein M n=1 Tax=Actomonas aquatica TaxID=2866162 RepID=A0ABZ1C5T4_9BACT|nr:stage II sporulation protein M [Opitutus sp. WL0086]WRQ86603.1 stage II sporulation protein M [Opitutus sp. WL0086]